MPKRFDRRRATVCAFDAPEWQPPPAVVLDTSVVAEALLGSKPSIAHAMPSCDDSRQRTLVVFNRLLELELREVVFNHALRRDLPHRDRRLRRFSREGRRGAVAALDRARSLWGELLDDLTWQCVELDEVGRRRLRRTRARRRDACGG